MRSSLLLLALLLPRCTMASYEEPEYSVIQRGEAWEVRQVQAYTIAEIHVDASFEKAGREAFRPLVRYIGGANETGRKMAMTTPVEQRGQVLGKGGPELSRPSSKGGHDVAFVLPLGVAVEDAPKPKDERIHLRRMAERTVAVLRYSGTWSRARYEDHERRLLDAIASSSEWSVDGDPVWARFNDPFTLWFLRRNEVQIPVVKSES
ncbi:MAG: heme-binding protein [Myxococcota bacterium]